MTEWSNVAVLKTVEPQGSVGSNPTLSVTLGAAGGLITGGVREWLNRAPC